MKKAEFIIKSTDEAINMMATCEEGSDQWQEAFLYLLKFGPPELRAKISEGIKLFFGIEPTHYDGDGNPFYDVSQVKEALSVSHDDIIDAVEPSDLQNANDLHRKQ